MSSIEISLFPIPGSVSLPFSKTSLHVFEPRYRKMIKDSIEAHRRIGVAHTQKVIAEAKTYSAHPIFSAGFAEIKETLPDGRLMIEITMDSRYQILEEVQQIPYKVVLCEPFNDDNETSDVLLRSELDQTLLSMADETQELKTFLNSKEWVEQSFLEYSFKIYSLVGCEPDILQKVLEMKSSIARVQFLKDVLTRDTVH
jgi:Lon protease-like protein